MNTKEFGKRLNIVREARNKSPKELAELCNLSISYTHQLLSGYATPSIDTLILLCNKLDVSPIYLLTDDLKERESARRNEIESIIKNLDLHTLEILTTVLKDIFQN